MKHNIMELILTILAICWVVSVILGKREEKREEERRKLLEQSTKYRRLREMSRSLESFCVPIKLRLSSLNEFRDYSKTAAIDTAYSEICAKYRFLTANNFSYELNSAARLSASDSEYVRQKEEKMYQSVDKAIHTPVKVIWSYTSPAGRNHYEESADVTIEDLREYEHQRELRQQHINSEKYRRKRERSMMTLSLRNDIMRRDNYRCQICGRTAQDGVILEVDHKKPIAKGGRTEPNNLWTLCQDCNRGKGAKYHISE